MAGRRLGPDEDAAWARLRASVRPIRPMTAPEVEPVREEAVRPIAVRDLPAAAAPSRKLPSAQATPGTTLDRGWDRRLARGMVGPDRMIDLHGHSLASAHARLDDALDAALAEGARVLLVVTGKPPRPEAERPFARGAIRAAIGDWIAGSRHAHRIAAVRGAHPRHGGTGALYVILRRSRT